jgi:hypothetical protein
LTALLDETKVVLRSSPGGKNYVEFLEGESADGWDVSLPRGRIRKSQGAAQPQDAPQFPWRSLFVSLARIDVGDEKMRMRCPRCTELARYDMLLTESAGFERWTAKRLQEYAIRANLFPDEHWFGTGLWTRSIIREKVGDLRSYMQRKLRKSGSSWSTCFHKLRACPVCSLELSPKAKDDACGETCSHCPFSVQHTFSVCPHRVLVPTAANAFRLPLAVVLRRRQKLLAEGGEGADTTEPLVRVRTCGHAGCATVICGRCSRCTACSEKRAAKAQCPRWCRECGRCDVDNNDDDDNNDTGSGSGDLTNCWYCDAPYYLASEENRALDGNPSSSN